MPKEDLSLDVIRQYKVSVPTREAKIDVLRSYVFPNADRLGQTIVFVRTREMARRLHQARPRLLPRTQRRDSHTSSAP